MALFLALPTLQGFPIRFRRNGSHGANAAIAKQAKVGMIWVPGRSPTLVSQNLKATTLTYLAIVTVCLWVRRMG